MLLEIRKSKWSNEGILKISFNLELEYIIKYHKKYVWTAHEFVGTSTKEEISDLGANIRATIREDKKDALVLVEKKDDLFWISVIMKNLNKIGLFEKPKYFVLSSNGRYLFAKSAVPDDIFEYILNTLGYERMKKLKLYGKCIKSLLKLLNRNEKSDRTSRPVYYDEKGIENDYGIDMTQRRNYEKYFAKCVDNEKDIELHEYTVKAAKCPWMGDETPILKDIEFRTSVVFSGNVSRIIEHLPIASIANPPFPEYLVNFSIQGRNTVKRVKQN